MTFKGSYNVYLIIIKIKHNHFYTFEMNIPGQNISCTALKPLNAITTKKLIYYFSYNVIIKEMYSTAC